MARKDSEPNPLEAILNPQISRRDFLRMGATATAILAVAHNVPTANAESKEIESAITLTIDTQSDNGPEKPIWRGTASWKSWVWETTPMVNIPQPERWFKDYFPWITDVRIMAALGGNFDPKQGPFCGTQFSCSIPEIMTPGDLDFTILDETIDNVIHAGLRPIFDLAQIPAPLQQNPSLICEGFGWRSSPPRNGEEYEGFLVKTLEHLIGKYGIDTVSEWGFSTVNEPHLGRANVNSCSFAGTENDYVQKVLLPTVRALKKFNLLHRFHLGAFELARPGRNGATPDNDNEGVSSDLYLGYIIANLKNAGFDPSRFESIAINTYTIYPTPNKDWAGSVFDVIPRLKISQDILNKHGVNLPLSEDETGIMFGRNNDSNTPLYEGKFAASWIASMVKIYEKAGNIDQIKPWWYLFVKNGRTFNPNNWERTPAHDVLSMLQTIANDTKLSVEGSTWDVGAQRIVDTFAAKDNRGTIRAIVFHHHDGLNPDTQPTSTNPDAPITNTDSRSTKLNFTNLEPGKYRVSVQIAQGGPFPCVLPTTFQGETMVDQNGNIGVDVALPHHSVKMVTIERVKEEPKPIFRSPKNSAQAI